MMEKRKKWYLVICIICIFFIFFSCGYFMIFDKLTKSRSLTENRNVTTDTIVETGHQTDIDAEKKEEYKQAALEKSLQETIKLMIEGSDSLVSIHNYDSADASDSTVAVTIYTEHGNDISGEQREAVERMVSGSLNRLPQSSITINVESL